MGAWALPDTTENAKKLQELMVKPLLASKDAESKLYQIYGDDDLFDDIIDYRFREGEDYDIRSLIKMHLKELLDNYKTYPESFTDKFEKKAIKILEEIIRG